MPYLSRAEWDAIRESPVDNPTPEAVRAAMKVHLNEIAKGVRARTRADDKLHARIRKSIAWRRPLAAE